MIKAKTVISVLISSICLIGAVKNPIYADVLNKPLLKTFMSDSYKVLLIEDTDFPIIENRGVNFVPINPIAEYCNDKLTYIDDNTVSITRNGVTCTYKVGSCTYTKNNEQIYNAYYWMDSFGQPIASGERFYFDNEVPNEYCTIFKGVDGNIYVPGFSLLNDLGYKFVTGDLDKSLYLNEKKAEGGKLESNETILNGTLD